MDVQDYDFVLNGYELGGGSLRVYDPSMQKEIFSILGISSDEAKEKFGLTFIVFVLKADAAILLKLCCI